MLCLAEFASDTSKANFASGYFPRSRIFRIHRDKETSSRSTLKTNSTGQASIRTHLSTCSDDNLNTNHKSAYDTVDAIENNVKAPFIRT